MQLQRSMVVSLALTVLLILSPPVKSQNQDIPGFCETGRPSKSAENCITERRYFVHPVKGCKAFAICKNQTEQLDQQTGMNYFVSKDSCRAACVPDVNCPLLTAPQNGTVRSTDGFMSWGGKVKYSCNEGYALVGSEERDCRRDLTWSLSEPVCEKQCSPPPEVAHASFGPVHTFYNKDTRIFYTCEEGYASQVLERTCESGGVWSGPEPVCEFQMKKCPVPQLIHNCDIFAPDRSVGKTVTYTCNKDFVLIGNATRTCGEDGQWEGEAPICWKLSLEYKTNVETLDITNRTLRLPIDTINACVNIRSSHPDLFTPVWYFDDELLRPMEYPHGVEHTEYKLTFTRVLQSREQEGNYTMKIGPYVVSFRLVVEEVAPTTPSEDVVGPVIRVSPAHVTRHVGGFAKFTCAFSGCPAPNVTWFLNNVTVVTGGRVVYEIFPSHTTLTVCNLKIYDLSDADVGSYKCVGENSGGVSSAEANLTLSNSQTRKRRSFEDSSSQPENLLCEQSSNPESVTVVARAIKELRRVRGSRQLRNYRFEVSKVLKGTFESSSSSSSRVGKRRLKVVVLDSSDDLSTKPHLNSDNQYILNGRMSDNVMYISGPQHIHHFTAELENHIQSC